MYILTYWMDDWMTKWTWYKFIFTRKKDILTALKRFLKDDKDKITKESYEFLSENWQCKTTEWFWIMIEQFSNGECIN